MWRDDALLLDMLVAARTVAGLTAGVSIDELRADPVKRLALERLLSIVGEAASRVSAELRTSESRIPWAQVIGLRNRLIHAYRSVDPKRLLEIAHNHIPGMVVILEELVPPDTE